MLKKKKIGRNGCVDIILTRIIFRLCWIVDWYQDIKMAGGVLGVSWQSLHDLHSCGMLSACNCPIFSHNCHRYRAPALCHLFLLHTKFLFSKSQLPLIEAQEGFMKSKESNGFWVLIYDWGFYLCFTLIFNLYCQ